MNENNMTPFQPTGHFSREARERWIKIPKFAQDRLLENVYCVKCADMVSIILETANMEQHSLILRGKCKTCGGEVCRLVEPEDD